MITSKTLLITILWFLSMGEPASVAVKDCESFKVLPTLSDKNGVHSLDLVITGGRAPYNIILSKETGELVTENFDMKHFDSLASGQYSCVVIDKQNCKRKLEITIP